MREEEVNVNVQRLNKKGSAAVVAAGDALSAASIASMALIIIFEKNEQSLLDTYGGETRDVCCTSRTRPCPSKATA